MQIDPELPRLICLALLEEDDINHAAVRAKTEQVVGAGLSIGQKIPEEKLPGFWNNLGKVGYLASHAIESGL